MNPFLRYSRQPLLALFMVCALLTSTSAQVAIRVSTLTPPLPQAQRDFIAFNGLLIFASATDGTGSPADGRELYRADGSIFNTSSVRNINPMAGQGSDPAGFVALGGKLYFAATTAANGRELWVTDGTFSGTTLVKDLNAGSASGAPRSLCVLNGKLYFSATRTGGFVPDLWESDGTEAGTRLLSDAIGIPTGTNVGDLARIGDRLFYEINGRDIWVSDGTAGGTRFVKGGPANPLNPSGPALFASINAFIDFGGRLIFRGNALSMGEDETWISDGTDAGTFPLEANPGPNASFPSGHTVFNGNVYFNATTPAGTGLWVTDGTQAGTRAVRNGLFVTNLRAVQGKLYFSASTAGGSELWSSDGTDAGTQRLKDINPGAGSSSPDGFTDFNGKTYFVADDGTTGRQLWATDGTETGTQRITTLGEVAPEMAVVGTRLFITAKSTVAGSPFELHRLLAADTPPPVSGPIANQTGTVGTAFFQAISAFTGPAYLFPVSYALAGLPPGITFSGGAGGIVAGNPTTAGVYSVTVSATSIGGNPVGQAFYTITINPVGGVISTLQLLAPIYDCSSGTLTLVPGGGTGSPIEYRVAGLRDWGTSPVFAVPAWQLTGTNFTLEARQGGVVASRLFTTACDGGSGPVLQLLTPAYNCLTGALTLTTSGGTGAPIEFRVGGLRDWGPSPLFTVPAWQLTGVTFTLEARQGGTPVSRSFTASCGVSSALQLLAPTYNCLTGAIAFNVSGGDGSPVEYAAVGVKDWSTEATGVLEAGVRLDPNSEPLTLMARQSGTVVTYTFNFRAVCGGARLATNESGSGMRVRVLGNPKAGETVDVTIDGAAGQPLRLTVSDVRGQVVSEQIIDHASATETRTVGLGKTAGVVLLRVSTTGHTQTVKIIRQ